MDVLLHTCCAPCSIHCVDKLEELNNTPTLYWYNPNIHPYIEYENRKKALEEYSKLMGITSIFDGDYGLREFTKNVISNLDNRCEDYCYRSRLEKTAKYASENGYSAFGTTLLISPYQKHDIIKSICEEMAEKYNINFIYVDFRKGFREGQASAKELGLYMQKYCGCIFSEEERGKKS
ncbi:MAG: epoxyqueuosine reductase QueH [Oscillospiraceae bacterium]|nr:epoxyqueuosine reductase QueH [Oscillospiraceae bacterium]